MFRLTAMHSVCRPPIQRPVSFSILINQKTAKELGLTIPQSLRVQAELID
jgi:ABC-type uncharacterized transport system substrate-binding protein